jgi:DNA-directed RNA polymerase subunit M/transcription elongation factor TFIIS
MSTEQLASFVKGVLTVSSNDVKYYETYFDTNNRQTFAVILKLVNGIDLQECEHELNELFLKKFNTKIYDSSALILWFHSLSLRNKQIFILALYMKIRIDEEETIETQEENVSEEETIETQEETIDTQEETIETQEETVSEEDYHMDELVECGNCGNRWDGFAQCNCLLYMPEIDIPHQSHINSPPRTRSQSKHDSHPRGWDPQNHYGMCGQSCPCCRAEVGDTLGACPICK